MSAVITFDNVTRQHTSGSEVINALHEASFVIEQGELVAVMGPSGSGKSTLLNLAGGLDVPTSGSIFIGESNLASLDAVKRAELRRRRIGYVFQDYNLIPTLTLAENVALPLELDDMKENQARVHALAAMKEMGIEDLADRFPAEVSRGQAQRAAISRAFVGEERILLADEPTGALDSQSAEEVMRIMRERVDRGGTGLLVTHESRFAGWADRVIYLRDGEIVSDGRA